MSKPNITIFARDRQKFKTTTLYKIAIEKALEGKDVIFCARSGRRRDAAEAVFSGINNIEVCILNTDLCGKNCDVILVDDYYGDTQRGIMDLVFNSCRCIKNGEIYIVTDMESSHIFDDNYSTLYEKYIELLNKHNNLKDRIRSAMSLDDSK